VVVVVPWLPVVVLVAPWLAVEVLVVVCVPPPAAVCVAAVDVEWVAAGVGGLGAGLLAVFFLSSAFARLDSPITPARISAAEP
jgi:hypothetical protein